MSPGLKPYPAHKDSGAPWLGAVPGHWAVVPNRALFVEVNERDHAEEPMLSVTITRGVVKQSQLLRDSSKKDSSREDKSAYKLVLSGDIAYNKMRAWQGAIGASEFRGIVSPAYVVQRLRSKDHLSRYYHHLFRTPAFAREAERWSYGITSDMWSLRPEHFKVIRSCTPPAEEQASIVRYLDYMDRRIRRYIHAKQKLIKLLHDQKQVIIHHAVTGQIDVRTGKPHPVYKDSGVEWLGRVPEHWEVRRLKHAVTFSGGGTPPKAETSYWAGAIPWVSPKDMKTDAIWDTADHITEEAVAASATSVVEEGAVLVVVRSGILRRCIPVAINAVPVAVNQDMKVLRPAHGLTSLYLMALIQGNQKALLIEWTKAGTTVESIEHQLLANCRIPLPPLPEQAIITGWLKDATANADAAMQRVRSEIELVSEFHVRLVSDVVTGKLDVREVAANLPDEGGELEPLADEDPLRDEGEVDETVEEEAALEEVEA